MELLISTLTLVLPVIVLLGIGMMCRVKGFLSPEAIKGMKNLASMILLPTVVFNALVRMELSVTLIALIAIAFLICLICLGAGFLTKPLLGDRGVYHPFLMSGFDVGSFGYALLPLLFGQNSVGYLASLDAGCCIFFFTIYISLIENKKAVGVKNVLRNMFSAPTFVACLLALVLCATGLGRIIFDSPIGEVLTAVINMIVAPTTAVILIIVGYQFEINRELLKPVLKTSALRLVAAPVAGLVGILILRALGIQEKLAIYAILFLSFLPAPYALTIYAKKESEQPFLSMQLSMYIIVTLIAFVALSFI